MFELLVFFHQHNRLVVALLLRRLQHRPELLHMLLKVGILTLQLGLLVGRLREVHARGKRLHLFPQLVTLTHKAGVGRVQTILRTAALALAAALSAESLHAGLYV